MSRRNNSEIWSTVKRNFRIKNYKINLLKLNSELIKIKNVRDKKWMIEIIDA